MSKIEEESAKIRVDLTFEPESLPEYIRLKVTEAPWKLRNILSLIQGEGPHKKPDLALWQEIMWNVIVSTIYEALENNKPKDLVKATPLRNLGHLF